MTSPREEVIPILYTADALASAAWYERLGFTTTDVHRFPQPAGRAEPMPAFVTIERGNITLFLSEHKGDARPNTLIYLRVENVLELAAAFGFTVDDNPWGPDFQIHDLDGNRLRINTPSWW